MVKLNTKFNKILAVMLSLLIIFAAFGNIIPYVVQAEEADSDVIVISSARNLLNLPITVNMTVTAGAGQ